MIKIKDLINKQYIAQLSIIFIFLITLLFSVLSYIIGKDSVRRTFIFPSADKGEYIVEYRNLTKEPIQGDVQLFIDELLLGSTIERTQSLFSSGTKVLSCFQRNQTLYLNLSSDLLEMGEGVIEIRDGMDLLKKNIQKNFSKIHEIVIFVNGKIAFEN
ncbi:MAG: GerMN domain-containing protein [Treponema sp.]|nr:GerMN domain-containing protein [Treponema sp.]MCI7567581.1 GerMN domain-containing protein [Treponema sp.]